MKKIFILFFVSQLCFAMPAPHGTVIKNSCESEIQVFFNHKQNTKTFMDDHKIVFNLKSGEVQQNRWSSYSYQGNDDIPIFKMNKKRYLFDVRYTAPDFFCGWSCREKYDLVACSLQSSRGVFINQCKKMIEIDYNNSENHHFYLKPDKTAKLRIKGQQEVPTFTMDGKIYPFYIEAPKGIYQFTACSSNK